MRLRRALVPLLALACLDACKGDGGIDSGLPPSKPATDLQPDEQTQLCEAVVDYYNERLGEDDFKRFECTAEGIGVSLSTDKTVAACAQARDACLARPDDEPDPELDPEPEPEDDTCEIGLDWATCNASVDELEACFTEYTDQGANAIGSFSCDRMPEYVKELPMYDDSVLDPGPACQAAQAKCPSLDLGGGDDDDVEEGAGET